MPAKFPKLCNKPQELGGEKKRESSGKDDPAKEPDLSPTKKDLVKLLVATTGVEDTLRDL